MAEYKTKNEDILKLIKFVKEEEIKKIKELSEKPKIGKSNSDKNNSK